MAKIHYDRHGRTVVITMEGDNDLNLGTVGPDLNHCLATYAEDDELWCCVVTGAGQRAFSAGADLQRMGNAGGAAGRASVWDTAPPNVVTGMALWKPLIAAVNGYCLGAGCMFALACDIRIASETAEFGMPEVKYGTPAGMGGPQRLPRLIALGPALEMLLTGDRISAQQALQWGLVNRVVPQAALLDAALELAGRIVANPPLAVRATKELVYRSLDMSLEDGMRLSGLFGAITRNTEDAREGVQAFREKRKPAFHGR
jgi:enoyl-CoA hydratase/carnithine racemase